MNRLLEVQPVCTLDPACADQSTADGLKLLLHPECERTLISELLAVFDARCAGRGTHPGSGLPLPQAASGPDAVPRTLALLVGPEGGFSPGEVARAQAAGYRPVTLGPRVLRTETAALAALAALRATIDDFSPAFAPT